MSNEFPGQVTLKIPLNLLLPAIIRPKATISSNLASVDILYNPFQSFHLVLNSPSLVLILPVELILILFTWTQRIKSYSSSMSQAVTYSPIEIIVQGAHYLRGVG
uniref:Uncharacterized protein n=1 Tax=Candidozyma auris TaxID=498019 RepID=A0A0L0NTV0_CANAR